MLILYYTRMDFVYGTVCCVVIIWYYQQTEMEGFEMTEMTKKDKETKEKKTKTKKTKKDKDKIKISNNINIKIGTEKTRTKRKYTRRDPNKTKAQMGDGSQNRHTPVAMSQPNIIMPPPPPTDYNKLAKDYLAPQTEAIQKQLLLMAPPTPAPAATPAPRLAIKNTTPRKPLPLKGFALKKIKAPITDISSFDALKKETIPELKKIFRNAGVPTVYIDQIKRGKKEDAIRAFIEFQKSKTSKTPPKTDPYDYFDENRTTDNTPKQRAYAKALFNVDTPSSVNADDFGIDPNEYNQPFESGIATSGNLGAALAPTSAFALRKTPYDSDTDIDIGPPSGTEYDKIDPFQDSDSDNMSKKQLSPFRSQLATTTTADVATLPSQEATSVSDPFFTDSDVGKVGGGTIPSTAKKVRGRPKATSAIQTKNQPKTPAPKSETKAASYVSTRARSKKQG